MQVVEKIVEVPQVQTVEKIVQAAPTFVETIAPAPVSYARPAPIVETFAPAPMMAAPIMPAPIVETFAPSYAMPAPMTTMAAPVLETFAPAPIMAPSFPA